MNKILYALVLVLYIVACKKEDRPNTVKPSDNERVAASIIVKNSEKQSGNLPASTNNILLDPLPSPLRSLAGKYVVIHPSVQSGTPAGYYLKVKGASIYAKVNIASTTDRIVVQLPENIEPGNFALLLSAFDASNNVSNIVETVVEVVSPGGAGSENLTGTWKLTAKLKINGDWDRNIYERRNGTLYTYHCFNNTLQPYSNMNPQLPTVYVAIQQFHLLNAEWVFNASGMVKQDYREDTYILNFTNTTCDNLVYVPDPTSNRYNQGTNAWTYNSASKTLSILYNYETAASLGTYSEELEVAELTATKMIVKHKLAGYTWEYSKQ